MGSVIKAGNVCFKDQTGSHGISTHTGHVNGCLEGIHQFETMAFNWGNFDDGQFL